MDHLDLLEKYVKTLEELVTLTALIRTPDERDKLTEDELAAALVLTDVIVKLAKESNENIKKALGIVMSPGVILPVEEFDVTVEKRVTKKRTNWDHPALISVVAEAILDDARDEETGAITVPYPILMSKMFEYASINYWRVKKLKELGVAVDEYSEAGQESTSFHIGRTEIEENDNEDPF